MGIRVMIHKHMQTRSQAKRTDAMRQAIKPIVKQQATEIATVRVERSRVRFIVKYDRDYSDDGVPWYSCQYTKQAKFTSHKEAITFISLHGGVHECQLTYDVIKTYSVVYEEVDASTLPIV